VQPLHDDDDGTPPLVVLPAVESVVIPVVGSLPLRVGERLLRLRRIIDQDDVGTASGQHLKDTALFIVLLSGKSRRAVAWGGIWMPLALGLASVPLESSDAAAIAPAPRTRRLVGKGFMPRWPPTLRVGRSGVSPKIRPDSNF
jgi:hypothetical protein